MNIKKMIALIGVFVTSLLYSSFEQSSYDVGKARVFEVMYKGPGGIEKVNKKLLFAETKNLAFDLNIAEMSHRFGCLTQIGQGFINFILQKVVSPKDTSFIIQKRQKLIQLLAENHELREKILALIQQAVEHEAVVMKFMQGRFVLDPYGNPIEYFNKWMDSKLYFQVYDKATTGVHLATAYDNIKGKAKAAYEAWNDIPRIDKVVLALLLTPSFDTLSQTGKYVWDSGNLNWKINDIFMAGWLTVRSAYGLYTHYMKALDIRNSLYSLNQLIFIATQIEDLCAQYQVESQFKVSSIRSEQGLELLNGLNQSRYQEKDSYFFATPAVHTFIHQVYEYDMNFAPVYAAIAEMDAYVALARKMAEVQQENHKFCFVEFLDEEKPMIQAKEFWNMLVSKGIIVTNDIFEGRNIILTGSNEGGKTTAIRAILQNIVLAQTFGIAAASEFKVTPFDVIHSYLNISDNILEGRSRYAAELKQAQNILDRIKSLKPDEKFFFTLDELFTGTNGEDGAAVAYNFIHNIGSKSGIQFIYATHFDRLKQIGLANSACVNYKIEAPYRDEEGEFVRDEQGQLVYPYKLSLGANDVNVALERAKDAGIFVV